MPVRLSIVPVPMKAATIVHPHNHRARSHQHHNIIFQLIFKRLLTMVNFLLEWVLNLICSIRKKLQDNMDEANRYVKRCVSLHFISIDMDQTKCMIDVMIFKNMEKLVDRMQDTVHGISLRRDITLDYIHPSVFTGADLVNWIMYYTEIVTTENVLYLANLLFSYGFFFSITRQQTKVTNDEQHCYRFQRVFKRNRSDIYKLKPTHNEEFFRQPRYPIGRNSFELLDLIPTYSRETNQPIFNMTNTSNCVLFEDTSIQMNNCKNKNNNIANVNTNFQLSNERESSVSNSQDFEKPPEIFIHCVKSEEFEQLIIDKLRQIDDSNNLNFIASFNHLKIQMTQPETYRKTIRYLDDNNILYYTSYKSLKNTQKSFRVILRNLPPVTNVLKIKKELEILGFSVRQVFNMKHKKTNVSLPLFTIDLEPSHINEEIFRIDTLLNIDVEFEEPYNKGAVDQCENCQDFGHVWPDCVFQSRCVRCGKNHASSECTEAENTPATCALCEGDHPANYKGCRVYKIFRHLRRQIPDDIVRSARPVPKPKTPDFWISSIPQPGDYQYAVYLCKKQMEVKDLSDMADYEYERLEYLKKVYCSEWGNINMQAETEIKIAHQEYDRYEKEVMDTQECAFWDLHRPKSPCNNLKVPLDYEKLLEFKELTDWDEDKIIDAYIDATLATRNT